MFVCGTAVNQDEDPDLFTMVFLLRIDARAQEGRLAAHDSARPPGRDEAERQEIREGRPIFESQTSGWAQPRLWHVADAERRGPNTRAPPGFVRRLPLWRPLDSRLGAPSAPELGGPRRSLGSAGARFEPGRRRQRNSEPRA